MSSRENFEGRTCGTTGKHPRRIAERDWRDRRDEEAGIQSVHVAPFAHVSRFTRHATVGMGEWPPHPHLLIFRRANAARFFPYRPSATLTALPISAGFFTTRTPAASKLFIFSTAVPFPPEMMAPA